MEILTPRQETILNCVIEAHIESAHPIGSSYITERYNLRFSPATVRYEMGFLEERGYLTHPHTSSGRIPTDSGYRYYVNHGLHPDMIPDNFFQPFVNDFSPEEEDLESFGEKVSALLSSLSNEVSLVLAPDPLREDLNKSKPPKLFLQGTTHMLEKPEFQDLEKIRTLFKAFEEKKKLTHWLANHPQNRTVSITIGHENEPEELSDCTVISTRYFWGNQNMGAIAIIGPRRMRYAWTVPLVYQVSQVIQQMLENRDSE